MAETERSNTIREGPGLGLPVAIGQPWLAKVAAGLLRDHPDISIEWILNDDCAEITANGYDLWLRAGEVNRDDLVVRHVCHVKRSLVSRTPVVDHPRVAGDGRRSSFAVRSSSKRRRRIGYSETAIPISPLTVGSNRLLIQVNARHMVDGEVGFCATAADLLREAATVEPADFHAFAAAALPRLEAPFVAAFARFDGDRAEVVQLKALHQPAPALSVASASTVPVTAPVLLASVDVAAVAPGR